MASTLSVMEFNGKYGPSDNRSAATAGMTRHGISTSERLKFSMAVYGRSFLVFARADLDPLICSSRP